MYLMSDCILFASLFAAFAVLRIPASGLFELPFVLLQTILLLTSSLTAGCVLLASTPQQKRLALAATLALGLGFLGLELFEFTHLIANGHGPQHSAFLSAFFTLVGTHGAHVALGCIWILVSLFNLAAERLRCFVLFWHFLDIVWIFIFTFVYLWGML